MKLWKKLSLRSKLITLSIFMTFIILSVSINSYVRLHQVEKDTDTVAEYSLPNILAFSEMESSFKSIRIELRTLAITGLTQSQEREAVAAAKQYIEKYQAAEKKYLAVDFLPGEQKLYDVLKADFDTFLKIGTSAISLFESNSESDREKMLALFRTDCPNAAKKVHYQIEKLMDFHKKNANQFVEDAHLAVSTGDFWNILLGVSGSILGLVVGFFISLQVSESLSSAVQTLSNSSSVVSSSSAQIAAASGQLAQSTTEQSASLEETAASLEEITAMISRANESAKAATSGSEASLNRAEVGRSTVEQMMQAMQEINSTNNAFIEQIQVSNRQLEQISEMIEEIGTKTKVINEIVFQTKLLSFNASVESARAGEHGKGFAVVASEVGSLAQMSGNAAKEISQLLDTSMTKVGTIVKETTEKISALSDQGKEKIEAGLKVAEACFEILSEIVENSNQVASVSKEIAQANSEQTTGVSEINKAMGQLDTVTQQNAAAGEQTASAAKELSFQAEQLQSIVTGLKTLIKGGSESSEVQSSQAALIHPYPIKNQKLKKAS